VFLLGFTALIDSQPQLGGLDDRFDLGLTQGAHFAYENGTWDVALALHVECHGLEPGHINHHLKPLPRVAVVCGTMA
jgi:hypothetical protein